MDSSNYFPHASSHRTEADTAISSATQPPDWNRLPPPSIARPVWIPAPLRPPGMLAIPKASEIYEQPHLSRSPRPSFDYSTSSPSGYHLPSPSSFSPTPFSGVLSSIQLPSLHLPSPNIPSKSKSVDLGNAPRLPSINKLTFSPPMTLYAPAWSEIPWRGPRGPPIERDSHPQRRKSATYPTQAPVKASLQPPSQVRAKKAKPVKKKTSSGTVGALVDLSVPINFPIHPSPSLIEIPPYQRLWIPSHTGTAMNIIVQKAYSAPVLTSIIEDRAAVGQAPIEAPIPHPTGSAHPKPPRKILTVFEYQVNSHWVMWDHNTGLVHITGLWKAVRELNETSEQELLMRYKHNPDLFLNGKTLPQPPGATPANNKADIARLIESAPSLEVAAQIKRIRGGFLKIQGTWLPFEIARTLALRICYHIRYCLVPMFGDQFPRECLKPDERGFGRLVFDPKRPIRFTPPDRLQPQPPIFPSAPIWLPPDDPLSAPSLSHSPLTPSTTLALHTFAASTPITPTLEPAPSIVLQTSRPFSLKKFRFPGVPVSPQGHGEPAQPEGSVLQRKRSITASSGFRGLQEFPYDMPTEDEFTSSALCTDEEMDQDILDASKSLQLLSRGSSFSSVNGGTAGYATSLPVMSNLPVDVHDAERIEVDPVGDEGTAASSLLALSTEPS